MCIHAYVSPVVCTCMYKSMCVCVCVCTHVCMRVNEYMRYCVHISTQYNLSVGQNCNVAKSSLMYAHTNSLNHT